MGGQPRTELALDAREQMISGNGNGPVDAFVHALRETYRFEVRVLRPEPGFAELARRRRERVRGGGRPGRGGTPS